MEDRTIIILALILAITFLLAIISCKIIQYLKNKQEYNLKKYQQYIFMIENSFPAEKDLEGKNKEIENRICLLETKVKHIENCSSNLKERIKQIEESISELGRNKVEEVEVVEVEEEP